ncbi:MAG: hypothetical protein PHO27_12400 [Sulfuricurvum sp.]|nr:hypothetical protein [Sulfuricurvum sp.]
MKIKFSFKRILKIPLYAAVLLFILFEEIIWEQIAEPIASMMQSLHLFARFESLISGLNSKTILVFFLVLLVISEVLGVAAAALVVNGSPFLGGLVYISKLPLASFSFWLFKISKEKLLKISWFARVYERVMDWIDVIKSSEYYQNMRTLSLKIKALLQQLIQKEKNSFGEKIKRFYHYVKSRKTHENFDQK